MARTTVLAIFFVVIIGSCVQQKMEEAPLTITLNYAKNKPVSVDIPSFSFPTKVVDSDMISLALSSSESEQSILGTVDMFEGFVRFTPVVPFKSALSYEVRYAGKTVDYFAASPNMVNMDVPELKRIYPTTDTVPENLLKIHLAFSQKMSVMPSSDYVHLLNANGDTLKHIFLRLETELWNIEQTLLTLWLEPGRIKKGLLPNLLDGIPIEKGNIYTIAVSGNWKGANGIELKNPVKKTFYVSDRDEEIPSVSKWTVSQPDNGTIQSLIIDFDEALDYTSIVESFHITRDDGKEVEGTYEIKEGETAIEFTPTNKWGVGTYEIDISRYVEDLAANNLNRPFDRDLAKDSSEIIENNKRLSFTIVH